MTSQNEEKIISELLPIEKSIAVQYAEIKTNIIKMFVNRGLIKEENFDKYVKKIISDDNDDLEYILTLDNESNYNTTIKNKKIYIKIFDYKITSVTKTSSVAEFLSKYSNEYILLVVDNITSKSEKQIIDYNSQCEIFKISELKICIVEHVLVPKHIVLTKEEAKKVLETYNAKK